jgi:hypothetical protein
MRMREENAPLIPGNCRIAGIGGLVYPDTGNIEKEPLINMKLLKTTLLFGGLVALATSVSAETPLVNVNVPFTFVAGGKTMPAGSYTIGEPSTGGILLIRGNQPDSTALVLAVNAGPSANKNPGVTFSRRGGSVTMSTVEIPGGSSYSLVAPEHKTASAVRVALPRK